MPLKVAIACGGTGGHLFPGLAVGETLLARGHEVLIFTSEKQIDTVAMEGRDEFRIEKLRSIGMPSPFSPAIFAFASRCYRSYRQCKTIFKEFQPDAVLGMGGFTSTAPIVAGKRMGAKTFVHDSNAIPGKANKLTARFCDAVLLGFEDCARHFPNRTTRVTGTPIRNSLLEDVDLGSVRDKLRLRKKATTVLIMGGSQGAHGINASVIRALPALKEYDVQFLHLTGMKDDQIMREAYEKYGITARVETFYHAMEELYALADVVIARSGAASSTELAHFGLPAILIPYPYAAEDHQTLNAQIFVRGGAAVMVQESTLSGDKLASHLCQLLDQPEQLKRMSENMRRLSSDRAAENVVKTVEEYCQ